MKRFACVLLLIALLAGIIPSYAEDAAEELIVEDVIVEDVVAEDAAADGAAADEVAEDVAVTDTAAANTTADIDAVKLLQIDLIAGGYLGGKADGIMGPATEEAIRQAQEALGLPVNGVATPELTEALLQDAFPLQLESQNSYVYRVQRQLSAWGYLEENPTGYFGSATQKAVKSFQQTNAADAASHLRIKWEEENAAVADDVVIDIPLFSAETINSDGVVDEDWYDYILNVYQYPRISAKLNDRNDGVRLVQKRLHALGYLYPVGDGLFGDATELALKYFQRRNGLAETGVCNDATSDVLFSVNAVASDEYVMPYMAYVKRSKSRVYIMGWDGSGYNTPVQTFKCSCGKKSTPTITGTFYATGHAGDWYYMKNSNVWVQYAFQIQGNYFFHSVLFNRKGSKTPTSSSVYALGSNVSHGCIRLSVKDAKWIYDNCPNGMKVVIE